MASNVNVKAVVTAEDRASGVISGISNSFNRLGQVVGGLALGSRLKDQLGQAVDASNTLQNSLIGLSSISNAFGVDANAASDAAKRFSADGIIPLADSAKAFKTALASGFSLEQTIQLLNGLKDQASFNRQSFYDMGGAVNATLEGIKNGNSVLADATGTTTNLSVMAKNAGISIQDMGSTSSNSAVRMAYLNGFLKETARSTGDAAKYSETFSGAQARLSAAVFNTRARIGDLAKAGLAPLVGYITDFLVKNQQMVVSMAFGIGAAAAFAAAVVGVAGAIALAVTIMGGPFTIILAAISALLGIGVYQSMQKVQQQMGNTTNTFSNGSNQMKRAADDGMGGAAKKARELAEKLADIDDQMVKTTRDFRESLAQIVKDHQDKVNDLRKQLDDENKQFTEAQTGKEKDFKETQDTMVRDHQRKVDDISAQIKQEQIVGTEADQTKLNSLQLRLAQENEDFNRQMALNQTKYQEDTAKAVASHEEKKNDFQVKLDEETAFLTKHNADVSAIRDVQLLDEIDKLKRSNGEQMAEFAKQKEKTIRNAQETTAGIANSLNSLPGQINQGAMAGIGDNMGKGMAEAFKKAFKDTFTGWWTKFTSFANEVGKGIGQQVLNNADPRKWFEWMSKQIPSFATGVTNFSGGMALVGERGPELAMLPQGTSIKTAQETNNILGGGSSSTVNVTFNGVFTGNESEMRALAIRVFEAGKDAAGAKNMNIMDLIGG
jgi:hypothetical protein